MIWYWYIKQGRSMAHLFQDHGYISACGLRANRRTPAPPGYPNICTTCQEAAQDPGSYK